MISACWTRSGYAFTVRVTTCVLDRIASSVENVLNPCFLLMSKGQGKPRTVRFFMSYWKISEKSSLCLSSGALKSNPGVASWSPIMLPFFPSTEGIKLFSL